MLILVLLLLVLHPRFLFLTLIDTSGTLDVETASCGILAHELKLGKVFANKLSLVPVETILTEALWTPTAAEHEASSI